VLLQYLLKIKESSYVARHYKLGGNLRGIRGLFPKINLTFMR
jgi:hypothetical protein